MWRPLTVVVGMVDSLSTHEISFAAFRDGADALARVLGLEQPSLLGRLVLGRRAHAVAEAVAQRAVDRADRQRRPGRDLGRDLHHARAQLLGRDADVCDAELCSLLA